MAVHDTQDDDIVALRSIDDKVGPDNSDADVAPETWARTAGAWMSGKTLEGRAELLCVVGCDQWASPFSQLCPNVAQVIDRLGRKDDPRHALAVERSENSLPCLVRRNSLAALHG